MVISTKNGEIEPGLIRASTKFCQMINSKVINGVAPGYIKYVLKNGSLSEKTRLIRNLNKNLVLSNKKLVALNN